MINCDFLLNIQLILKIKIGLLYIVYFFKIYFSKKQILLNKKINSLPELYQQLLIYCRGGSAFDEQVLHCVF